MKGLLSVGSGLDEIYLLFSDTGQICCSASGLGEQIDEKLLEKIAVMLSDNAQKENSDMVYRIQSSLGVLYVGRHARSGFCVATFIPNGSMGNGMWQSLNAYKQSPASKSKRRRWGYGGMLMSGGVKAPSDKLRSSMRS